MNRVVPVKYNQKEKCIHWVNGIVHIHDYNCGCRDPLECSILQIFKQEKHLRFSAEEKKFIKQCLGEDTTVTTQEEDVLGDDVLESLFTTDFGEENDTKENVAG